MPDQSKARLPKSQLVFIKGRHTFNAYQMLILYFLQGKQAIDVVKSIHVTRAGKPFTRSGKTVLSKYDEIHEQADWHVTFLLSNVRNGYHAKPKSDKMSRNC